jgi:hypothetical protein
VTAAEFRKSMGCVADSTLGIAAASFDFTGLPTTYAHLMVVISGSATTRPSRPTAFLRGSTTTALRTTTGFTGDSAV